MKDLNNLEEGDYIAFEYKFGAIGSEIVVDKITCVYETDVLVHFMYGLKSDAEFIKKSDIIAIGDPSAKGKINGWRGNFNILLSEHPLLNTKND